MTTALNDLAAQIGDAHASSTPLRVVGGGTWLNAGRPCDGEPLRIGAYDGIVEYVPGDLTLTARAGTTLKSLEALTAQHGQWLALDPVAAPNATIGATVATASDGPLAASMGRVRDTVLGLECITGTGEIIRAGGRVVKNVAGFDLVRLQTGAWGTLGVITEVTVRLRARPQADRAFVIRSDARSSYESRLSALVDLPIAPLALELLSAPMAIALGVHDGVCLLVRIAGNSDRVQAQQEALSAAGDAGEVPLDVFDRLSEAESEDALVARISHLPTHLAGTWHHVMMHLDGFQCWQTRMRATLSRGVVRVVIPAGDEGAQQARSADWPGFVRRIAPPGGHVTWERLPAAAWPHVECAVGDRLSAGLRRALDPAHILNRGLLGEELDAAKSVGASTGVHSSGALL